MAREYLCQFGDCEAVSEQMPVLITVRRPGEMEQLRFCSMRHAAEWCFHEANASEIHNGHATRAHRPENGAPVPPMTADQQVRLAEWVRANVDPDDIPEKYRLK